MDSYLGNNRAYYSPSPSANVSTTSSGPPVHGTSAPQLYSPTMSRPSSRQDLSRIHPSPSPGAPPPLSRISPHPYSNAIPPHYAHPRQPTQGQQRHPSDYLMGHNSLQHAVSYAPTHSRPPDARSLEVTRVGPVHTFSSISAPEVGQLITSRPNFAHATTVSTSHNYKETRSYVDPLQSAYRGRPSSSTKGIGGVSHPTLIKAEEPTTLSAAHYNLLNSKKFETATEPVPYSIAKRADDPYYNDKFEESFACIKKVENPYALGHDLASTSRLSSAEVEIKRQKNKAYQNSMPFNSYPVNYSLNGFRTSMPDQTHVPKKEEAKSDHVLDLSVKTVRQTADSTAPELEGTSPPTYYSSSGRSSIPTPSRSSPYSSEGIPRDAGYHESMRGSSYHDPNGIPSSSRQSPNLPVKRPHDLQQNVYANKVARLENSKSPYNRHFQASSTDNTDDSYNAVKEELNPQYSTYNSMLKRDSYKPWPSYYEGPIKTEKQAPPTSYNPSHSLARTTPNYSSQLYSQHSSSYPYSIPPTIHNMEQRSSAVSPKEIRVKSEFEINNSFKQVDSDASKICAPPMETLKSNHSQSIEHIIPISISSKQTIARVNAPNSVALPISNKSQFTEELKKNSPEAKTSVGEHKSMVTIVGKSDILSLAHEELTKIENKKDESTDMDNKIQKVSIESNDKSQSSKSLVSKSLPEGEKINLVDPNSSGNEKLIAPQSISSASVPVSSISHDESPSSSDNKVSNDSDFKNEDGIVKSKSVDSKKIETSDPKVDTNIASAEAQSNITNSNSVNDCTKLPLLNETKEISKCETKDIVNNHPLSVKDVTEDNIDTIECNSMGSNERPIENVVRKNSPNVLKQRLLSNLTNIPTKSENELIKSVESKSSGRGNDLSVSQATKDSKIHPTNEQEVPAVKDIIGNSIVKAFKESENATNLTKIEGPKNNSELFHKEIILNQKTGVPVSEGLIKTSKEGPADLSQKIQTAASDLIPTRPINPSSPWQSIPPHRLAHASKSERTNAMDSFKGDPKLNMDKPPLSHQDQYIPSRAPFPTKPHSVISNINPPTIQRDPIKQMDRISSPRASYVHQTGSVENQSSQERKVHSRNTRSPHSPTHPPPPRSHYPYPQPTSFPPLPKPLHEASSGHPQYPLYAHQDSKYPTYADHEQHQAYQSHSMYPYGHGYPPIVKSQASVSSSHASNFPLHTAVSQTYGSPFMPQVTDAYNRSLAPYVNDSNSRQAHLSRGQSHLSHPPASVSHSQVASHPRIPGSYLQPPVSHPHTPVSHPHTPVSHPHTPVSHPNAPVSHPNAPVSHHHTPMSHPHTPVSHPHTLVSHPHTPVSHPHTPVSHPHTPVSHSHIHVSQPHTPVSHPNTPVLHPHNPVSNSHNPLSISQAQAATANTLKSSSHSKMSSLPSYSSSSYSYPNGAPNPPNNQRQSSSKSGSNYLYPYAYPTVSHYAPSSINPHSGLYSQSDGSRSYPNHMPAVSSFQSTPPQAPYGYAQSKSISPRVTPVSSAHSSSSSPSPSRNSSPHNAARLTPLSRDASKGPSPSISKSPIARHSSPVGRDPALKPLSRDQPQIYGPPGVIYPHSTKGQQLPYPCQSPVDANRPSVPPLHSSYLKVSPDQETNASQYGSYCPPYRGPPDMTPSSYQQYQIKVPKSNVPRSQDPKTLPRHSSIQYPMPLHTDKQGRPLPFQGFYPSAQSKPLPLPPTSSNSKMSPPADAKSSSVNIDAGRYQPPYAGEINQHAGQYPYPSKSHYPYKTPGPSIYPSQQSTSHKSINSQMMNPSQANQMTKPHHMYHQQLKGIKTPPLAASIDHSSKGFQQQNNYSPHRISHPYQANMQHPTTMPYPPQHHASLHATSLSKQPNLASQQDPYAAKNGYNLPQPAHAYSQYSSYNKMAQSNSTVLKDNVKQATSVHSVDKSSNHGTVLQPQNLSSKNDDNGKSSVLDKLPKAVVKKDTVDFDLDISKDQLPPNSPEEDMNSMFSNLLDDLESHKDTIISRKSCIVTRRYYQKVQMQNAFDNNEAPLPMPIIEDDSESEREEPVKKFRGKFKSIKDKAVERVILTYASHSDESATEMFPDEDASDFEEELIKEIEAKARKGKSKSNKLTEVRKKRIEETPKKNKFKDDNSKKVDRDFSLSSTEEEDNESSLSTSRGTSSSDSNSEDSLYSSGDDDFHKKRKVRGRKLSKDVDSSNSDEEFTPRRKTRKAARSSSEDFYSPAKCSSRRGGRRNRRSSSPEVKRKRSRKESSKRKNRREKDRSMDSDFESKNKKRSIGRPKKLHQTKRRRQVTSSESEEGVEEVRTRRRKKEEEEEKIQTKGISSSSDEEVAVTLKKEIILSEPKEFDANEIKAEEISLSSLEVDEEKLAVDDPVIKKLRKEKESEMNRDDVLEMKSWNVNASAEMKRLLEGLPETRLRFSWKKPEFSEDFNKGWQQEVKKYKSEVARLPKKLVKISPSNCSVNEKDKNGSLKKKGKLRESSNSPAPAKSTRSKSGFIKTSMAVAQTNEVKVSSRPEMSSVMQKFFDKVLGDDISEIKKFPSFSAYSPPTRTPTGLTPTPSVALSMMASDDSDRDSLVSLRHDLPASDSVPVSRKRSIANSLIKRFKKKYNARKLDTQWLNKTRPLLETTNKPQLLPTPGLSDSNSDLAAQSQFKMTTFFRKDSVNRYRDNFDKSMTNVNELTPVLVPSRTRTKSKAILDAATIKSVFGSEPPFLLKSDESTSSKPKKKKNLPLQELRCKEIYPRDSPNRSSVSTTPTDFLYNTDYDSEFRNERSGSSLRELAIMQDIKKSGRRLRKYRKFRSGFDYIRKKKKVKTEEEISNTVKRKLPVRKRVLWPEEVKDVANEVRNWVINKGLGETVLHKAARLQYHDVVIYCLESSDFNVNAKDNAGYTPLHEACNRGNLDIAQALCGHGAQVNAPGFGGMRPLHEAIENGHIELARLLLTFGADSSLATYGGQTCLALASDPSAENFLKDYLSDLKGKKALSWPISGPTPTFDLEEQGANIFAGSSSLDISDDSDRKIVFEYSAVMLPATFVVAGKSDEYVKLPDILQSLSLSKRDFIIATGSIETLHLTSKEFETRVSCNIVGYPVRSKWKTKDVTMVKLTPRIKDLFQVERIVV